MIQTNIQNCFSNTKVDNSYDFIIIIILILIIKIYITIMIAKHYALTALSHFIIRIQFSGCLDR